MLLAAVGIGAVGVVQTSMEPSAEAVDLSLGTITAQMREHSGRMSSDEANCIRYMPAKTSTSSEFVTSSGEALAAHGWTEESCPETLELEEQSVLGITPAASGDFNNGESFLLAEVTHDNKRVEGNGDELYDGVARLRFGDFDDDPTIDLPWELWETTNFSDRQDCELKGRNSYKGRCIDRVLFTIPDPKDMTKDGRGYRLTIDKVVTVDGDNACPSSPVRKVMADDREEEDNVIKTAEGKVRRGCVYGTVVVEEDREEIAVAKSASRDWFSARGQTITYTFVITNTGNQPLGPGQFEVTDDKIDGGVAFDCGADEVSLDPSDTVSCTRDYVTTADDVTTGEVMNMAFASYGELNSATVSATVDYADLLIAKSASPTSVTAAGQSVTYTYTLTNNGAEPLGPDQFTVTDDKINSGTAFNCGAAATTIAVDGTLSCTSTYTVTSADVTAGSIVNLASAQGAGVTSPTVSATVTVTSPPPVVPPVVPPVFVPGGGTPVLPAATPSLNLTKTASPDTFFAAGEVITYTYTILNDGTSAIGPTQFTITDNKINGGQPFNCGPATKVISVNLNQMCTAYYTITAADVAAGSVTNVAFASGGTVDSNTATATVSLVSLIFPAEIPVTGSMSTTVIAFGLVTLGLGLGLITLMRRRRIL